MASDLSSTSPVQRRSSRRATGAPPRHRRAGTRAKRSSSSSSSDHRLLGGYTDRRGRDREVLARHGALGSVLVVDRDRATHGDRRLVAHLAADEPAENAALICSHYLEDAGESRCRCRLLTDEDARSAPFADQQEAELDAGPSPGESQPVDRLGCRYRLELVQTGMSIPELRWRRHRPGRTPAEGKPVSVREAVACMESYEPVRALTVRALSRHGGAGEVSTTVLRAELARVRESPIVLNRRLRELVLARIERDQLSMSEIAIRCGRVKRDHRGNESGETSWLARRLGLLPEGGRSTPTPWIHSDVLALIARSGLGVSPREVEL
jgi:hypothetical protein